MGRECLATGLAELRRQPPLDVFLEREDRFRLCAIPFEDDGHRLGDVRQGLFDDLLADAARESFRANRGEPFGERRASGLFLSGPDGWCFRDARDLRGRVYSRETRDCR